MLWFCEPRKELCNHPVAIFCGLSPRLVLMTASKRLAATAAPFSVAELEPFFVWRTHQIVELLQSLWYHMQVQYLESTLALLPPGWLFIVLSGEHAAHGLLSCHEIKLEKPGFTPINAHSAFIALLTGIFISVCMKILIIFVSDSLGPK